ncbi:MAG TPA: ribonuclease E inhibitor RraB [Mycobacteriales bacterium]|nr:ribonuclease E inhibitor RraB [Mycobacteriales bacterium]
MGLFRRRRPSSSLESTGYPDEDKFLQHLASLSPLSKPRTWDHRLYFTTEAGARTAAGTIEAAGWRIQRLDHSDDGSGWVVIATQDGVVTSVDAVRRAREFFDGIAASVPGGVYDGWEATV